ncbi:MAG TPA: J domain-containing protein [Vicinamibacteria bacterium]|nr:J domain-containing protein [Vicinamibacteria bacterium]
MSSRKAPEELELESRKQELDALRAKLVQGELELATFRAELDTFEQAYLRAVGPALAELDAIQARIALIEAERHPADPSYAQTARHSKAQANESAAAVAGAETSPAGRFQRSDELKSLFREAAKKLHPDLAVDDEQRSTRTVWMARVNAAYRSGDGAELRRILDEWQFAPEAIQGDTVASELVRAIRSVSQIRLRLEAIANETETLRRSDVFHLYEAALAARAEDRDLLAELRSTLQARLAVAKMRLTEVESPQ